MESVSSIHNRWSFTRLNPSSIKISFIISIAGTAFLILVARGWIYKQDGELLYTLLFGLPSMVGLAFFDFWSLRKAPLNKLSKVFHVSAFSNVLWASTAVLGLVSHILLGRESSPLLYLIEGMFLAIGLRIAIFRSVFGTRLLRSVMVGIVQPIILAAIIIGVPPPNFSAVNQIDVVPLLGIIFVGISILWTVLADKAGRPNIKSTFDLLQAFLAAWTDNDPNKMERFTESRSEQQIVKTLIGRFTNNSGDPVNIILPDIHPGPFNPIGGSNLPYVLFTAFSRKAIVLHSISDHSLNIPSKSELDRYVMSLDKQKINSGHNLCSLPCQVHVSGFTATGLKFGNTAILLLSRAPEGMDDLSDEIQKALEGYSISLGFSNTLVVDCHNALGTQLSQRNNEFLLTAGKRCLKELNQSQEFPFRIGFANLRDISYEADSLKDDLGGSGLATVVLHVNARYFVIGWADSNNMDNTLRRHIVSYMSKKGLEMLEICTSDTHSTSGKRTRQGYYAFGSLTDPRVASEIFYSLSRKSIENVTSSKFELFSTQTKVKVMGKRQFDEYARALNKSMHLSKIFVLVTIVVYAATLLL